MSRGEEGRVKKVRQQAVLAGHKRVGKRFVPPMLQLAGEFQEVKWLDGPLPEFLWLGLLHRKYGYLEGSELAVEISKAAALVAGEKASFATTSAYTTIDRRRQQRFLRLMDERDGGVLVGQVREALLDLVSLYPRCPLVCMFGESDIKLRADGEGLGRLRDALRPLYYRQEKEGTLVTGTAVRIAIESGRLVVPPDASLLKWRELEAYPDGEEARRVGASCRAAMNMIFSGPLYDSSSWWPGYFWDRGLELEPCVVSDGAEQDE